MTEIEKKIIYYIACQESPVLTTEINIEISKDRYNDYNQLWNEFRALRESGILIFKAESQGYELNGLEVNKYRVSVNTKNTYCQNIKKHIKKLNQQW